MELSNDPLTNASFTGGASIDDIYTSVPGQSLYTVPLYAQWEACTTRSIGTNVTAANVVVDVVNNQCRYTVTCTAGYKYTSDGSFHGVASGDHDTYTFTLDAGDWGTTLDIPACATRNEINLNWDANNGTINGQDTDTGTCDYGVDNDIDVPQPERPGYTFGGWEIESVTNNP